jgi:hypothetical protein
MTPDTFTDSELGEFHWDSRVNWWAGSLALGSTRPFQLYIKSRNADRSICAEARQSITRLRDRDNAIRCRAAEGLLETLNSIWNEGVAITPEEFARRLTPEAIVAYPSGRVEVSYGDDGMFLGHSVAVRIAPDGALIEALIQG